MKWQTIKFEHERLKHFSLKELKKRKEEIRIIVFFTTIKISKNKYKYYHNLRIRNKRNEIIGYITFKQFLKCEKKITKNTINYIIYKIK